MRDCPDNKVQLTKAKAEEMKRRVGEDRGKDMRVYECPYCHAYHLTKKKPNNKDYD